MFYSPQGVSVECPLIMIIPLERLLFVLFTPLEWLLCVLLLQGVSVEYPIINFTIIRLFQTLLYVVLTTGCEYGVSSDIL